MNPIYRFFRWLDEFTNTRTGVVVTFIVVVLLAWAYFKWRSLP